MRPALAATAAAALFGCAARADDPPASAPAADLVVLVSLDTTRADSLGGPYGNSRGTTPNLDSFARDSVVFTDAWTVGNLTSLAHAGLFTSRYPSEIGLVGPEFHLDGRVTTLADLFGLYGWQTAAFTSGGHLSPDFGLDRGFSTFAYTPFQGSMWHTVPASLAWLDTEKKAGPTLLFVHGYDAHTPYLAPAPFGAAWMDTTRVAPVGDRVLGTRLGTELVFDDLYFGVEHMLRFLLLRNQPRLWDADARAAVRAEGERMRALDPTQVAAFTADDAARVREGYEGAIAYQDAMFGELVAGLKARGLYERAWIVVVADHGENLGEEGRFGHGELLTPAELHVPLYIRGPGFTPRVINAPVSILDVLPTFCDAFGFTAPAQGHGQSLLPWLNGAEGPSHPVRFAEGSLKQVAAKRGEIDLVFEGVRTNSPYFNDALASAALAGPAFHDEERASTPEERAELRAALTAWRGSLEPLQYVEPASKEAVDAMKANGYFTP